MTSDRTIQRNLSVGAVLLAAAVAYAYFANGRDLSRLFASAAQLLLTGLLGGLFGSGGGTGDGGFYMPALRTLWSRGVIGAGFNGALLDGARFVSTSLALQAFGLAAGTLAWLHWGAGPAARGDAEARPGRLWAFVLPVIVAAVPAYAIATRADLFITYRSDAALRLPVILIAIGLVIAGLATRGASASARRAAPGPADTYALFAIGIAGGIAMALISIGLGAAVVVYLLLRGFAPSVAAASATLAALPVAVVGTIAGLDGSNIAWPIVLAGVPGAIAGGALLRAALSSIEPRVIVAGAGVVMAIVGAYLTLI